MPEIGDFKSLVDQLKSDPNTATSVRKIVDAVAARINTADTAVDRRALTEGLLTYRDQLVKASLHGETPLQKPEPEPGPKSGPKAESEPEG